LNFVAYIVAVYVNVEKASFVD